MPEKCPTLRQSSVKQDEKVHLLVLSDQNIQRVGFLKSKSKVCPLKRGISLKMPDFTVLFVLNTGNIEKLDNKKNHHAVFCFENEK